MVERAKRPSTISAAPTAPQPHVDISDDRVIASLPTGESVEILLHGATVISWKSGGQEHLWLSHKAVLNGSKPVRGGIPVVFPVFGPPPPDNHPTSSLSQHGFARNVRWEFLGRSTSESNSLLQKSDEGREAGGDGKQSADSNTDDVCVKLDFGLYASSLTPEVRKAWPYDFGLVYSVTLARDGLQTIMNVRNEGEESFDFQLLLHTYLRVKDISTVSVTGLLGATYVDKVLNATTHTDSASQLRIEGEIDRVYKRLKQDTTSVLESGKPRFDVIRDNLDDTVIWNPWSAKAAAMSDFEPKDGWTNMLCVEVGSVDGWQKLEPGDTYECGQVIRALG